MIGANSSYAFFVKKDRSESIALKREDVIIYKVPTPKQQENFIKLVVNLFLSLFDDLKSPLKAKIEPSPTKKHPTFQRGALPWG